jgi:hypothetical protein
LLCVVIVAFDQGVEGTSRPLLRRCLYPPDGTEVAVGTGVEVAVGAGVAVATGVGGTAGVQSKRVWKAMRSLAVQPPGVLVVTRRKWK